MQMVEAGSACKIFQIFSRVGFSQKEMIPLVYAWNGIQMLQHPLGGPGLRWNQGSVGSLGG